MIQTVINRYKYLIGVFLILFSIAISLYINLREENVYLLYEDDLSNCYDIKEYEKRMYYVFCDGKKSIFFEKDETQKTKSIKALRSVNLISKKDLFIKKLIFLLF